MGIGALNYQGVKGGLKLNDVIEEFKYAYQGQEIKAGDFVNYIEGVAGQTTETSVDTRLDTSSYSGNRISAVALDENRVFIAHRYSTNSDLYGMVVTINGATIIAGTHTVIRQTNSADSISAVALDSSKVLIAHNSGGGANAHLRVTVCTIDGTTITANSTKELTSSTYTGSRILAKLLSDGNVFIGHSYGSSYYLYGIVVAVSGTSISNGTDTALSTVENAGNAISTCLLPNGNIFIAHGYGSSYYLYGIVCFINGTTITKGNDTAIENSTSYSGGSDIFAVVLPNNNVFIAHRSTGQVYLYGIVCTIDGSLVFVNGTDTIINNSETYTGARISAVALDDTRVLITHSYSSNYYLYAVVVTINGTTVTVGTDTTLNAVTKSGNTISTLLLQSGTIFIAHSYDSNSYLYAQIWGIDEANNIPTNEIAIPEYEQQVTLATEPPFDGIALSSGIGGDDTGHNQQVKIARAITGYDYDPTNLIVNGDFSNGVEGWVVSWNITATETDGVLCMTSASSSGGTSVNRTLTENLIENHIYYFAVEAKATTSSVDSSGGSIYAVIVNNEIGTATETLTLDDNWHKLSMLYTAKASSSQDVVHLQLYKPTENGTSYWDNVKLYDLTAHYGAGNEPTQEWCDNNL